MTRKLYPYWDEMIQELSSSFDPALLDQLIRPAESFRPPGPLPENVHTLQVKAEYVGIDFFTFQTEFQMAIRLKAKLSPKYASILLQVEYMRALLEGVDMVRYLSLLFLLEYVENFVNRNPRLNLESYAKAVCLAKLTILGIGSEGWVSLVDRIEVDERVKNLIFSSGWTPSPRTIGSWKIIQIENYLQIRIVPLEQSDRREENSIPYSSYTKGYSESGKGYTRDGKTYGQDVGPKAQEPLDGDDSGDLSSPIEKDSTYQILNSIILQLSKRNYKSRREEA